VSGEILRSIADQAFDFPAGKARRSLLPSILRSLISDENSQNGESAARAWLANLSPSQRIDALPQLAFARQDQLPILNKLFGSCFSDAELTKLAADAPLERRTSQLNAIAELRALRDPVAATAWALASLEGRERHHAMERILETSAPDNAVEATRLVETLHAGPLHDAAVSAILSKMHKTAGFRTAADWMSTMSNSPLEEGRSSPARHFMCMWARNEPANCVAWIESLPSGQSALEAATGALSDYNSRTLDMARQLPEALALAALKANWGGKMGNILPLAEAAVQQPAGPIRAAAIAKSSRDFGGLSETVAYTQRWLDWATSLPTPADRVAAFEGAVSHGGQSHRWAVGIRAAAEEHLK
jgi:hypothetical protein